jgi:hypothetical protein
LKFFKEKERLDENDELTLDTLYSQIQNTEFPQNMDWPKLAPVLASTATAQAFVANYEPFYYERINKKIRPPQLSDYDSMIQELERYLVHCRKEFNIELDLVAKRRGAWSAFHSSSPDRLTQATNSMRLIMTALLSQIASNKNLEEAGWKLSGEENKKLRIRYLLFGNEREIRDDLLDLVTSAVENCQKDYDRLLKIAHGSKANDKEVENLLIKTELIMVGIFRASYALSSEK